MVTTWVSVARPLEFASAKRKVGLVLIRPRSDRPVKTALPVDALAAIEVVPSRVSEVVEISTVMPLFGTGLFETS